MSALKKPVSALIGVMAVLLAGMFFAVSSATAAPVSTAPIVSAPAAVAPHVEDGYGGAPITFTFSVETLPDGRHKYTLTISGFEGGELVIIFIHSTPVQVGSATASSTGSINTSVIIPASYTGSHTLVAVGQKSGVTASTPIQIGGGTTTGTGSGSGSGLSSTGVAVVGIGALGVVLLAGGGLLLVAGRRRKTGEI